MSEHTSLFVLIVRARLELRQGVQGGPAMEALLKRLRRLDEDFHKKVREDNRRLLALVYSARQTPVWLLVAVLGLKRPLSAAARKGASRTGPRSILTGSSFSMAYVCLAILGVSASIAGLMLLVPRAGGHSSAKEVAISESQRPTDPLISVDESLLQPVQNPQMEHVMYWSIFTGLFVLPLVEIPQKPLVAGPLVIDTLPTGHGAQVPGLAFGQNAAGQDVLFGGAWGSGSWGAGSIVELDPMTGSVLRTHSAIGTTTGPGSLAFGSQRLWVADYKAEAVYETQVTTSGLVALKRFPTGSLRRPLGGLAYDGQFVLGTAEGGCFKLNPLTAAYSPATFCSGGAGMAFADGYLFRVDNQQPAGELKVLDLNGTVLRTYSFPPADNPAIAPLEADLAVDPITGFAYWATEGDQAIYRFKVLATTAASPYPGSGGDFLLRTGIETPPTTVTKKVAAPGDLVTVELSTPGGTLVGQPFALGVGYYLPGAPIVSGPIYLGPWSGLIINGFGAGALLKPVLSGRPLLFTLSVPAVPSGARFLLQAVTVDPTSQPVLSSGMCVSVQ